MFDVPRPTDRQIAEQLRDRLVALSWWRGVLSAFPGGVVSVATASRVLGVSRQRIERLIDEGRLPLIEGMPGGNLHDRFIPIDALHAAPTMLDTGRPLVVQGRRADGSAIYRRSVPHDNHWAERVGLGPQNEPTDKISSYSWEPPTRRVAVRVSPPTA
ncbi:MAG: hypothetical protein IT436_05150 [Phycisphaerales bacterium]|nr:hypothetical protein [Phycisphaerales bacterium]